MPGKHLLDDYSQEDLRSDDEPISMVLPAEPVGGMSPLKLAKSCAFGG